MSGDIPAAGSDEDLMLRYGRGDLEAFHSLYNRHRAGLYRYFLRQTGAGMAEELFQDVWASVIQSRRRYRPTAGFRTWLYTLARNRLIDYWRARGRLPAMDDSVDDDCLLDTAGARAGPLQLAGLRDCIEYLLAQVAALPNAQRETFLLCHEGGLSLAQIAAAMKTGTETAKSRLRYAMDRLRMALPEECLEEV
ncbi:MAG: sigma-70 family RNA polymerase sigma factor [Gammaproteobacteria bacterium]